MPSRDLYIEKDSAINQEVDRLRHAATAAVFARRDVIVVASVSCIYGLGSPETYEMNMQILRRGEEIDRDKLLRKLVSIQYTRNDIGARARHLPGEGGDAGGVPRLRRDRVPGDAVRRRSRAAAALRPADGRADRGRPRARRDLAGHALQREGGDDRRRRRGDRARAERALRRARGRRQAAGVASAAPAHPVRHGDAARDGVLLGDRELLAHPRRAQARRAALLPDRLLPQGFRLLHRRVTPDRAADRGDVRGGSLAQAHARGLRLQVALARWTTGRRPLKSFSRSRRSSCSCPPRRASTSAPARRRIVEQIVRPDRDRRSRGAGARDQEPDRRSDERDPQARRRGRARAGDHADQEDERGPLRSTWSRWASRCAICTRRSTRSSASRSSATCGWGSTTCSSA